MSTIEPDSIAAYSIGSRQNAALIVILANLMPPLFRQVAIEHATVRRYGTVLLARPISFSVLTLFFVSIAAGIIAILMCVTVTRKAQITGILQPSLGLIRLQCAQSGVVIDHPVSEGQTVKAGDVLFVLSGERASATRGETDSSISDLIQSRRESYDIERSQQRVQAQQRIAATQSRVSSLSSESQRIEEQISLQERRVALASDALKRYSDLQAASYVSAAGVQDRQAELLDQQQRLGDLQRAKAANLRDKSAAIADLNDQQIQAQRDQQAAARSIAAIDQDLSENEAKREIVVRAPQDGIITGVAAYPGQTIVAGQSMGSLIPTGSELEAELYAPSRSAGFVKSGMPVLLRYQAYPYQKFGQFHGTVREISSAAMQPQDFSPLNVNQANGLDPSYRIRVRLDSQTVKTYGNDERLKPGMALDASIILEKRRLIDWVLDPLYSISGRI